MQSLSFSSLALTLFFAAGCSSSSSSSPSTNADGTGDAAVTGTAVEEGHALVTSNICQSCHGTNLAGSIGIPSYPAMNAPNITPDSDTGIGGWTDAQITSAILASVDDQGQSLCAVMQKYPFTATEAADVVVYLRSIPAVSKDIPDGTCPE